MNNFLYENQNIIEEFINKYLNVPTIDIIELLTEKYHFHNVKNVYFKGNSTANIFICAHIDTLNKKYYGSIENEIYPLDIIYDERKIYLNKIYYQNHPFLKNKIVLGGDDRCGVYILLKLYDFFENVFPNNVFYFLIDNEEINGGEYIKYVFDKNIFDNKIIISMDLRGNEMIFYHEYHSNKELAKVFRYFFEKDGYIIREKYPDRFCIIDYIQKVNKNIFGVNIGCGYYKEHTMEEYIVPSITLKTLHNLEKIITFIIRP